ncbi:MAG: hypothetical protein PHE88_09735 [Elusimicrobia bacterium]|nr:hypothetical protein [Elusimicrobiota bacterium]
MAFLILTGLTHFGTFIFALFFLSIFALYSYKKKAIIPLVIIVGVSIGIIAIFDLSRFNRLLSFWTEIFERPALLNEMLVPPDYLNILFSILLAIFGIITLKTKGYVLTSLQKALIFASIICLIAFSFPLLDGEYFKRLNLLLFIPQILLIIQIAPVISVRKLKTISISLLIFTSFSILSIAGRPKEAVIDQSAYENLKELKSVIKSDNQTIVIARHGLEWWTAWVLKTKIGQDKAIDKNLFEKYRNIIFITQINGFNNDRQKTQFHEPIIPLNAKLIFASNYFKAFKVDNEKRSMNF